MHTSPRHLAIALAFTPLLAGCGLANQGGTHHPGGSASPQANLGEQAGTIPKADRQQAPPIDLARTPQAALNDFVVQYINWTYASLASDQTRLAAESVGEARAAELQAREQVARDTPLQRAHIYNRGTVVAIAPAKGGGSGEWVIVTREQTGGNQEYAGLQAAFHITLATVRHQGEGWVVSAWRPQT